jgi:hypothetical protein
MRTFGAKQTKKKYFVEYNINDFYRGTAYFTTIDDIGKRFSIDRTTITRHIKCKNNKYRGGIYLNISLL